MKHKCDIAGCSKSLVIDDRMKPHRPISRAKLSCVRDFTEACQTVLTGCSVMPLPDSKYYAERKDEEFPIVSADKVNKKTKKQLFEHKKEEAASEAAPGIDFLAAISSSISLIGHSLCN